MPEPAQHVAIISGLSGAGKTATSKLFEDIGYTVVDNMPAELVPDLAELVASDPSRFERVAIVLDVRAGDPRVALGSILGALEGRGISPRVVFLEARDDVLIRRFSETRHRHPLQRASGIAASIAEERRLLEEVRETADVIIDTSELSGRQLRERIGAAIGATEEPTRIAIQVISFGYKYGLPLESDFVLDVRFIENPFYEPTLRPLSGLTEPVRSFVLGQENAQRFLTLASELFADVIPACEAEGRSRLTVAVGCTGGYHRSITVAEELAADWRRRDLGHVDVWHRDLERA
jgi:UPF0042 nucleotide-binding protein